MSNEIKIPEFLKPNYVEGRKPLSKVERLLLEYEEKFYDGIPTEPDNGLTDEEMCIVLEECIKKNVTFRELTGFKYEDNSDY